MLSGKVPDDMPPDVPEVPDIALLRAWMVRAYLALAAVKCRLTGPMMAAPPVLW